MRRALPISQPQHSPFQGPDGPRWQSVTQSPLLADLLRLTAEALPEVEALFIAARENLRSMVTVAGKVSAAPWRTPVRGACAGMAGHLHRSLRQMQAWALRIDADGKFGEMEALILQIGFGEYLQQIQGGIPMSQGEIARLQDLGLTRLRRGCGCPDGPWQHAAARTRLVELMQDNHGRATFGATGLDEELEMIRDQFRRFADEKVDPARAGLAPARRTDPDGDH
jgi:(2S)-methylsuccinyl-CoA dehydrogenase